jgi:hypothetical protein
MDCEIDNLTVTILFFLIVTPCRLAALKMEQYVSPKRWYLPMCQHGVTTQNNIVILTAVRTSNFTTYFFRVYLSPSRKMLKLHFKIGRDRSLPNPIYSLFIITL